ncbi:uncharacterized protein BJ171DRAFT_489068 [Polychytrium aggregatum]|uniref:uncharacterized protein n=1 Tax=Polychytrium aggregatum TaxID=110093 RepID=UPI0022FE0E5F|nr:uncharacterized protein BJ171DRAFT_489068 [Polychytrium aggregatum]KAI9208491.1 hypothetical protein BJ171DRAFT_489068 [Polychytrium aggregatum]
MHQIIRLFLSLAIVAGLALSAAAIPNPKTYTVGAIDLTVFDFVETGFTNDPTLQSPMMLFWSILNLGTANETLHAALVLDPKRSSDDEVQRETVANSWMGFALGKTMLTADFVMVWANPRDNSTVKLIEALSPGQYSPPKPAPQKLLTPGVLSQQGNVVVAEFYRPTQVSIPNRLSINTAGLTDTIWAYNVDPDHNSPGGWQFYHGWNRGGITFNFATGANQVQPYGLSRTPKYIHGGIMMLCWLLLYPAGIFCARYCKSLPRWLWIHVILQSVSSVLVWASAIYMLVSLPSMNWLVIHRHTILGRVLVSLLAVQVLLGFLNRLGLSSERMARIRSWIKLSHDILGWLLILASIVQIGFGIQNLWPWEVASTGSGQMFTFYFPWVLFFFLVLVWLILFCGAEVYYRISIVNYDRPKIKTRLRLLRRFKTIDEYEAPDTMRKPQLQLQKGVDIQSQYLTSVSPFTWNDINDRVLRGDILVVANGKFVYDASQWLTSHPGGQVILYSCAGTDITNDYFHDAGFDAEEFVPRPTPTAANTLRRRRNLSRFDQTFSSPKPAELSRKPTVSPPVDNLRFPYLSQQEIENVIRARRTHVHTRLAIERLSSLLIGQIVTDPGLSSPNDEPLFDPAEFRRYALVQSIRETQPSSAAQPYYRLKFALLYPHDTRYREPKMLLPGHVVELQLRIRGRLVSRYFTPIEGSLMSAIEIIVRLNPKGEMSPYLVDQKPGDKQFKIRGPFGTPLVNPQRPINNDGQWCYQRMAFFTNGSALTAGLHLLNFLFFPTEVPIKISMDYQAQHPDELNLKRGQWVVVRTHYYDGWAEGQNMTTNQTGLFPLVVTKPRCGTETQLTIVNVVRNIHEICGSYLMEGALLSYPNQVRIVHVLTGGPPSDPHGVVKTYAPGNIMLGKVGTAIVDSILGDPKYGLLRDPTAGGQTPFGNVRQRIYICGTRSFSGRMYETIIDELGYHHGDIYILPDEESVHR